MTDRAHGAYVRYQRGPDEADQPGRGCRCAPCKAASAARRRRYRRLSGYGIWEGRQDVAPVRAHLEALRAAGVTRDAIAAATGVSTSTIRDICTGGRRYLHSPTAKALLAAAPAPKHVPLIGIQRRARALQRLGHTLVEQAYMLGVSRATYQSVVWGAGQKTWAADKAVKLIVLYNRLAWAPPPRGPLAERCRRNAARDGWPSPAAWDDEDIDDPAAVPVGMTQLETYRARRARRRREAHAPADPLRVELACAGELPWRGLTRSERMEVVSTLRTRGWTASRIARHLHISGTTLASYTSPRQEAAA